MLPISGGIIHTRERQGQHSHERKRDRTLFTQERERKIRHHSHTGERETIGCIFMVVQHPAQAVLQLFGIFLALKLTLSIYVVFWWPVQSTLCTGGRRGTDWWDVHSNETVQRQWLYFGSNLVLDVALKTVCFRITSICGAMSTHCLSTGSN